MIQIQNILAPVEFDVAFDDVVLAAVQFARVFQARLFFLHVDDPLAGAPSLVAGSAHSPAHAPADLQARVARFAPAEMLTAASATYHVRRGEDIAAEIVEFSRSHAIDLIVLGNWRKGVFSKLFFSSVEEEVIHQAPCHVLTVCAREK
jgi:nucleotide-binding universal stress UspA family protein